MRKKQHNNLILRLKVGDPTSQTDFEKPEQEGHAKATHAPIDGVAGLAQIVSTPAGTIGETSTTALEIGDDETEQNGKQKEERHDNGKQREQQYSTPETEKEVYVNDAEGAALNHRSAKRQALSEAEICRNCVDFIPFRRQKTEGFDDKITTLSSTHKTNQQKRISKPCIFTHKALEVVVLQDKKGISARSG